MTNWDLFTSKESRGLDKVMHYPLFLFNIVVDTLAIIIERAKEDGQIKGTVPHLVDNGLSILQYADDTLLFSNHDIEKVKNMKLLSCAFKQLLGLLSTRARSYVLARQDVMKGIYS